MHTVATVLGPIPIDALGFSLMHEHVLVRGRGGESALTRTRLALMQLRHNYVRTIVDATPIDRGRDPTGLVRLAQQSGMNILAVTGHLDAERAGEMGVSRLAALFVRELREGMDGGAARASLIRTGAGGAALTAAALRHQAAAAAASNLTGAPIMLRTGRGPGQALSQVDHLLGEGVPGGRIRIEHCLALDLRTAAALAERGVWLSADRFCCDRPARLARLARLLREGYAGRMLLSADLSGDPPGDAGEVLAQDGVPYGWLHLKLSVFKALSDRGVDADLLFRIAGENPKRFFTECQRKEP